MSKYIIPTFIMLFLSSCYTLKISPLSQTYKHNTTAIEQVKGGNEDVLWARAVHFLADKHISIKAIDKASGYIETDKISMEEAYKIDSDTTIITHPVYVIVQHESGNKMLIHPNYITANLKILIQSDSNTAKVRADLEDLQCADNNILYNKYGNPIPSSDPKRDAISTGILEKQIADYICTGNDSIPFYIKNGTVPNPKSNYAEYLNQKSSAGKAAIAVSMILFFSGFCATIAYAAQQHHYHY